MRNADVDEQYIMDLHRNICDHIKIGFTSLHLPTMLLL